MKNECCLIRDLLPLYAEDMVSDYTKAIVEKHIKDCPECRRELEALGDASTLPVSKTTLTYENAASSDVLPLTYLRKKLRIQRLVTIALTLAAALVLAVTVYSWLTIPEYFPYSRELLTVTAKEDGSVVISFNENVTRCRVNKLPDPSDYGDDASGTEASIYVIDAWTSRLDSLLGRAVAKDVILTPDPEEGFAIYYSPNGAVLAASGHHATESGADVLLYSVRYIPGEEHAVSMPRLALSYYVVLAWAAALLLFLALLIFWSRETIRVWLLRILFLPLSYILADLCIMGFDHTSYSMTRNFLWILLLTLLIFCALLLAQSLYRMKKRKRHDL